MMERTYMVSGKKKKKKNHFSVSHEVPPSHIKQLRSNSYILAFSHMYSQYTHTHHFLFCPWKIQGQFYFLTFPQKLQASLVVLFCSRQPETSSWMFTFRLKIYRALKCDSNGWRISECLCGWCVCSCVYSTWATVYGNQMPLGVPVSAAESKIRSRADWSLLTESIQVPCLNEKYFFFRI